MSWNFNLSSFQRRRDWGEPSPMDFYDEINLDVAELLENLVYPMCIPYPWQRRCQKSRYYGIRRAGLSGSTPKKDRKIAAGSKKLLAGGVNFWCSPQKISQELVMTEVAAGNLRSSFEICLVVLLERHVWTLHHSKLSKYQSHEIPQKPMNSTSSALSHLRWTNLWPAYSSASPPAPLGCFNPRLGISQSWFRLTRNIYMVI